MFFFSSSQQQITAMPADEFQRHIEALAAQKLEKPKSMTSQFNKYWNEIALQQYHFNRAETEVAILRAITAEELLDFYNNFIVRDAPVRHPLSIHIVSTIEGGAGCEEFASYANGDVVYDPMAKAAKLERPMVAITDLATFKSSKELYPMVQPYIDIQPKGARSKL